MKKCCDERRSLGGGGGFKSVRKKQLTEKSYVAADGAVKRTRGRVWKQRDSSDKDRTRSRHEGDKIDQRLKHNPPRLHNQ